MRGLSQLALATSAALVIAACSNSPSEPAPAADVAATEPAPPAPEATVLAAPPPPAMPAFVVTHVPIQADGLPAGVIGAAGLQLSLRDGVIWFSGGGWGYNPPSGQVLAVADTAPPIVQSGGGDIDLTGFPPGNVQITVSIDDSLFNSGYSIPADPWQAVALAVDPPGDPVAPTPVFDQASWPANFQAPSVAADQHSVTWIDTESDQNIYEYSVALDGPNGRIVIDPKIKPGGSTTR